MKPDRDQIIRVVEDLKRSHNFEGLLHFTDFSNLASIINQRRIYSRNYCQTQNIQFRDVADQEVIHNTRLDVKDCVRFYYKEKTMTLYRNEGIKEDGAIPHVPIPVYLLFDEEIMCLDYTVFANGNAGSQYTRHGTDCNFLHNMDWNVIFDREPIHLEDGPEKWEFKRKRQAELLSTQPISLEYLIKVVFRCNADYKRACNLFGKSDLYVVDSNMFNNRNNYIKDYSVEIINSSNKRSLLLKFSTNLPVVNHDKHEYKLLDMKDNELRKVKITYPQSYSGTNFDLEIDEIPNIPFKFQFRFYDVLSIEEKI